jgi:AraC-like DNA-binding protein
MDAFLQFIDRCQTVVGSACLGESVDYEAEIAALRASAPRSPAPGLPMVCEEVLRRLQSELRRRGLIPEAPRIEAAARRVALRTPEALSTIARGYIAAHFRDPDLRAARVAQALKLSRPHLSRLLKRYTGHGFAANLRRTRLLHSRELLLRSARPIKEVAADCGFASSNDFDRAFKREYGTTPTRVRMLSATEAVQGMAEFR